MATGALPPSGSRPNCFPRRGCGTFQGERTEDKAIALPPEIGLFRQMRRIQRHLRYRLVTGGRDNGGCSHPSSPPASGEKTIPPCVEGRPFRRSVRAADPGIPHARGGVSRRGDRPVAPIFFPDNARSAGADSVGAGSEPAPTGFMGTPFPSLSLSLSTLAPQAPSPTSQACLYRPKRPACGGCGSSEILPVDSPMFSDMLRSPRLAGSGVQSGTCLLYTSPSPRDS